MAEQATLFLIKPDAIQRGIVGAVFSKIEPLALEIIGAKITPVSRALAEEHYKHIRSKAFFDETVEYLEGKRHGISSVLAFVLWGQDAIERLRRVTGATHPEQAAPTTIRGAFGRMKTEGLMENVVHASSDPIEAQREIHLWFQPGELLRPAGSSSAGTRR